MKRLACLMSVAFALFGAWGSPATAGTVKGKVMPVEWAQEVEVCLISVVVSEWCAVPKADGSYAYPGVFGTVTFEFIPTYRSGLVPQYYDHQPELSKADYMEVGPGVFEREVNADLLNGGTINGIVSAQVGGGRISEVEVCAVPVSTSVSRPPTRSCDETNASGEYTLHSLAEGVYKVGFWGQGGSAEYQSASYKEPIELKPGQVASGIDEALVKGGQIRGNVFAAGGNAPLDNLAVCLFSGSEPVPRSCTDTEADGSYSFQGLPSGSYQVGFSLEASEPGSAATPGVDGFDSQYYDGVATRAQATSISVLAPLTVEGIDAHLSGSSTPPPAMTAPVVASPPVASIPFIPELEVKVTRCKKPRRRASVDGKVRCVKPGRPSRPKQTRKSGQPAHK